MKRASGLAALRRRHLIRVPLICVWLVAGLPASAQSARAEWTQFLEYPNDEGRRRVAKAISRCDQPTCVEEVAPDSADVLKLVALIRRGSRPAIDLGFLAVSHGLLDGGDLEDVVRSLGEVADTSPSFFLREMRKHHLTRPQVKGIVKMLPEKVIDDDAMRLRAIAQRIRSLQTVTDAGLLQTRDEAIAMLRHSTNGK